MEQINLNLIPNGVNPVAHCKQYDVGRTFRCNLFEGNSVYTLDGTETVECEVHKPDGNLVTLGLTNTGSTYVDVVTTLQMCACSGESLAAIKITSGGVEIGSLNFVLYCERSPLEGGITSDSGIYNLETQVSSLVASEVADQYDSANVIFDAEPTAGHGNGYAVTSEGIMDYVNPEETIENVSIASFDNGGDGVPVKELIVGIEPVQAGTGTPSPSNPRAISGWSACNVTKCGKNLCHFFNDGQVPSINTGALVSYNGCRTGFIKVQPASSYTLSAASLSTPNCFIFYYDKDYNYLAYGFGNVPLTRITPSNCCYIMLRNDSPLTDIVNAQLELGSTATTYEAYNGTTDTISLGGTVYGGELNVTTGKLTITHGIVDLGSLNWTYDSANLRFQSTFISGMKGLSNNSETPNWKCSSYNVVSISAFDSTPRPDNSLRGTVNNTIIFVRNTNYTDPAIFKTDMSGVQLVYELATPTTTTLTPTEVATVLGYNNIFANTGDVVSVTYYKYNMMGGFNLIKSQVGTLSQLTTTDKDSIVEAINEVDGDVGDLSSLTTTANSDLVSAINELDGDIGDLSTLTTTDQSSLVGAINELDSDKAGKPESVTFTPATGVTLVNSSLCKIDKLVCLTANVKFTGSAFTWSALGIVNYPPVASHCDVPAVSVVDGSLLGVVQVTDTGSVRIYPPVAQTDGVCGFSITYLTS